MHERRSIRSYAPTPVERDVIESIILDAAQAPPRSAGRCPGLSMSCRVSVESLHLERLR
ncbi:MAG: nitroreductase family protein [Geminicoccaceae bacterium]